jgi:DNA-binding CsgD family transcriptional regulator
LRHWPVLLLVTYRNDELTPRQPFAHQLPSLVREADGLRIDLRRLESSALRALVDMRYGLPSGDEDRLVAYLERHAEGNPFFASELLRALEEQSLLFQTDDGWKLGEHDRVGVPSFLRQVIEGRVARLGEQVRQPLAMAAVIGQEVPLALWAELASLSDEELLTIVEGAVEAHLLEAEQDGISVRFIHALTREALYEGVLPPRRRLWHRQVAETLIAGANPDPDAVAYHLQQAGDSRAPAWLIRAGERAQRAYAWRTACERYANGAKLLAGVAGEERTRARILCSIARLLRFADPNEGLLAAEEAIRLADQVGDAALAAEGRYMRGLLLCYTEDYARGCEIIESSIALLEALPAGDSSGTLLSEAWLADVLPVHAPAMEDGAESAHVVLATAGVHYRRGILAVCLAYSGRYAEALTIGERLLAAVDNVAHGNTLVRVACAHSLHAMAVALVALGRVPEARPAFVRAAAAYHDVDHHAGVAFTLLNQLHLEVLPYGSTEPALRSRLAAESEAALGRASGALPPDLSPGLGRVACLLIDGKWDEVTAILDGAAWPGNSLLRREATSTRAMLARNQGNADLSWSSIRSLMPQGPATPPGGLIFPEALLLMRVAADLSLDARDFPAACLWLEAHDRWLDWNGARHGRADGLASWARYYHAAGDATRARSCATKALLEATDPDQPLVQIAVHQLLGLLAKESGRWADAKRHLGTALNLANLCAAPFERGQILVAQAELQLALGRRGEAAPLLAEATAIAAELGATPLLAAAEALASEDGGQGRASGLPAGLTQREVEVLRLVAEGLSDSAVAERLFISPRTVSQHLRIIYSKLEVSSRTAATRFAVEHHLL